MLGAKSEHSSTSEPDLLGDAARAQPGRLRHPPFDICAIARNNLVLPLEEVLGRQDTNMSESFQRGKIT